MKAKKKVDITDKLLYLILDDYSLQLEEKTEEQEIWVNDNIKVRIEVDLENPKNIEINGEESVVKEIISDIETYNKI